MFGLFTIHQLIYLIVLQMNMKLI